MNPGDSSGRVGHIDSQLRGSRMCLGIFSVKLLLINKQIQTLHFCVETACRQELAGSVPKLLIQRRLPEGRTGGRVRKALLEVRCDRVALAALHARSPRKAWEFRA